MIPIPLMFINNDIPFSVLMYLDAGDSDSYPGTGTTWSDLTDNNNDGTLINGPTFTNQFIPVIEFDGIDDYVSCPDVLGGLIEFSVEIWFNVNVNSTGQEHWLVSQYLGGGDGRLILDLFLDRTLRFFINGNSINSNTVISTNTWYNVVFTRNSSGIASIYINGVEDANGNVGTEPVLSENFEIFDSTFISGVAVNGKIGLIKAHDEELTSQEVLQNYNDTKSRFGL